MHAVCVLGTSSFWITKNEKQSEERGALAASAVRVADRLRTYIRTKKRACVFGIFSSQHDDDDVDDSKMMIRDSSSRDSLRIPIRVFIRWPDAGVKGTVFVPPDP
jgi:hypothetical protein